MEMGQWPMMLKINNCAVAFIFWFSVDIKKLLTHSISPIVVVAAGLIIIYDFLLSRRRGLFSTTST